MRNENKDGTQTDRKAFFLFNVGKILQYTPYVIK